MILYEDKEILVCHKSAGMAVQSASVRQKDMVSVLRNHLGGGEVYVVHRLDQPVEGVVVFAKTKAAAADLSRQMADGRMKKVYQAVLELPEDAEIVKSGKRADVGKSGKMGAAAMDDKISEISGSGTIADISETRKKAAISESGNMADVRKRLSLNEWHTLVDYLVKDGRNNRSFVADAGRPGAKRAELRYRILKWWEEAQPGHCEGNRMEGQSERNEGNRAVAQTEMNAEWLAERHTGVRTRILSDCQIKEGIEGERRAGEGRKLALAEIELMTGRHHQIRVQMAHAGLPLAGDRKYNPRYAESARNAGDTEHAADVRTRYAECAKNAEDARTRYAEDAKNAKNDSASGYGDERLSPLRRDTKTAEAGQANNAAQKAAFWGNGGAKAPDSLSLCAVSLTFRHPATKKRVTFEVTPQFAGNLQEYYE